MAKNSKRQKRQLSRRSLRRVLKRALDFFSGHRVVSTKRLLRNHLGRNVNQKELRERSDFGDVTHMSGPD